MPDLSTVHPHTTTLGAPTFSGGGITRPTGTAPPCGSLPPEQTTLLANVEEAIQMTERYFVSLRKEAYVTLRTQESEVLLLPWGPRIDVVFDPKSAAGSVNGRVRLLGRTRGGRDFELASVTITNAEQSITLSGSFGCDEYVVKASAGSDPGSVRVPDSYAVARVYSAEGR